MSTIAPGATIGIIGGGQLGRMLALAAAPLGYLVHIFDPNAQCCARQVSAHYTRGNYDDRAALTAFAENVDVATYEFENIDAGPLESVAAQVALFPPLTALRIAQDRIAEKQFAAAHGGQTAPWANVETRSALDAAIAQIGVPAILKTTRFGYDGKGQARLQSVDEADAAWETTGHRPAILEAEIPFEHEFSVLVARGQDGTTVTWDAPENVHHDGILRTSTVPPHAAVSGQTEQARALALRIADALDYVGVLAIEFFVGADGPIFNEMAPRVHNSGHWTIEAAQTSQFENHIRAICGLPLGETQTIGNVTMQNLIDDDVAEWLRLIAEPRTHIHLYAKGTPSPSRKMGHVTRLR